MAQDETPESPTQSNPQGNPGETLPVVSSKEEQDLQDVSQHINNPQDGTQPTEPSAGASKQKKPRNKKKILLIASLLVLLIIVGLVLVLVLGKKTKTDPSANDTISGQSSGGASGQVQKSYQPNTVAYAFKVTSTDPLSAFWRPAAGGNRTEVQKLPKEYFPANKDTTGTNVVFSDDKTVYASTDAGKSYKKVYETTGGEMITSIKLSSTGAKIAVSTVAANYTSGAKVTVMDMDGGNKTDTVSIKEFAIYVIGWNDKQTIYAEGCYGCDGGRKAYKIYDQKTKESKDLLPGVDVRTVESGMAVSEDFTKMVYVQSTVDPNIKDDGPPGYHAAAPYEVLLVDLATGKSVKLATVGSKGEKNTNDTYKYRQFSVGFVAGTDTAYYAEGTTLYTAPNNKLSLLYTTEKPILSVSHVGSKSVILSTGFDTNDFTLSNYNLADKKAVAIFQGDNNTVIFGVTTQ